MKLLSRISVFAFLLSIIVGVTTATSGDLWDWIDNLNGEIPFGYTVSQKIAVDQISVSKIVIKSPVIQDDLGNKIKKYTVMFSQYPLSQILDDVTLIGQSKEKTFDFTVLGTGITLELKAVEDNINPAIINYLSVIPKDENGILGEISNEIWFKLDTQASGEGEPNATVLHAAPGADMSLANVTHTITQNKATLRWTAVDGSSTVDIFLWNPTSEIFGKLTTTGMTAESYTFTLTRNGEYIVNFIPNNSGTEHRYTFVANGIVAPSAPATPAVAPTIGKIPATGPKENIFIVFGIALVAYFVYRKMRAKH